MISKELLSKVLNITAICDDINNIELNANTITFIEDYWDEDEGSGFYRSHSSNIYELANKCKDWAATKGYILFSKTRLNSSLASCYFHNMGLHDYEDDFHNDFRAETEPEAIFKACQWILDNAKANS